MAIGHEYKLNGQVRTSDAEFREHEAVLYAKRITKIASNQQVKIDYDTRTDQQPVYIAYAPKGLAESNTDNGVPDGWLVKKVNYLSADSGAPIVSVQIAYGNYTSRAFLSYS